MNSAPQKTYTSIFIYFRLKPYSGRTNIVKSTQEKEFYGKFPLKSIFIGILWKIPLKSMYYRIFLRREFLSKIQIDIFLKRKFLSKFSFKKMFYRNFIRKEIFTENLLQQVKFYRKFPFKRKLLQIISFQKEIFKENFL